MTTLNQIFSKPITRAIDGVIKADDDASPRAQGTDRHQPFAGEDDSDRGDQNQDRQDLHKRRIQGPEVDMSRVPDTGSAVRDKEREILHLQDRLAYFRSIPVHRREAECADEGVPDCIALLRGHGVDAA